MPSNALKRPHNIKLHSLGFYHSHLLGCFFRGEVVVVVVVPWGDGDNTFMDATIGTPATCWIMSMYNHPEVALIHEHFAAQPAQIMPLDNGMIYPDWTFTNLTAPPTVPFTTTTTTSKTSSSKQAQPQDHAPSRRRRYRRRSPHTVVFSQCSHVRRWSFSFSQRFCLWALF